MWPFYPAQAGALISRHCRNNRSTDPEYIHEASAYRSRNWVGKWVRCGSQARLLPPGAILWPRHQFLGVRSRPQTPSCSVEYSFICLHSDVQRWHRSHRRPNVHSRLHPSLGVISMCRRGAGLGGEWHSALAGISRRHTCTFVMRCSALQLGHVTCPSSPRPGSILWPRHHIPGHGPVGCHLGLRARAWTLASRTGPWTAL